MNLEAFLQLPIAMNGGGDVSDEDNGNTKAKGNTKGNAETEGDESKIFCIGKDKYKSNRDNSVLQTASYIILEQELDEDMEDTISSLEELNTRLGAKSIYCISQNAVKWIITQFQNLDKDDKLSKLEESCLKYLFIEGAAGKNTAVSNNQIGFISFLHGVHAYALLAVPVEKKCPAFSDNILAKYTWVVNHLNEFSGKKDSDSLSYFSESLTKEIVVELWRENVGAHTFDDIMQFLMVPQILIDYLKTKESEMPVKSAKSGNVKPANSGKPENSGNIKKAVDSTINAVSDDINSVLNSAINTTVSDIAKELTNKNQPIKGGFSKRSYARTAEQYLMDMD